MISTPLYRSVEVGRAVGGRGVLRIGLRGYPGPKDDVGAHWDARSAQARRSEGAKTVTAYTHSTRCGQKAPRRSQHTHTAHSTQHTQHIYDIEHGAAPTQHTHWSTRDVERRHQDGHILQLARGARGRRMQAPSLIQPKMVPLPVP